MKVHITSFGIPAPGKKFSDDAWNSQVGPNSILAIIADGVGRAEQGREAAQKTVQSFLQAFKCRPETWGIPKALEEFTRLINQKIHQESLARFDRLEMLSTLAVVALDGDYLWGLNVGDSP